VYAIGGIIPEDINELISCGVYGIAVSGILTHAAEKRQLIKKLKFSLYAPTDYCQHKI
jgi:thiamine-phosphate pyrophosphorylase